MKKGKLLQMAMILGIETSCDETSAAVVEDGRLIHSLVVASQIDLHQTYGGVFPEVASRQHVLAIVPVIEEAMNKAGVIWSDLSAVAVTHGPGLAGSLLVGANAAKGIAAAADLPLIGVNHLEAHFYANWLVQKEEAVVPRSMPAPPDFPLLCLIVSGGHTTLLYIADHGRYKLLGQTIDDAAGEAFDKVARLLDLGYPGGPIIERTAQEGDPRAFDLPRAWLKGSYDFSFSGLKTAVLRLVQRYGGKGAPSSLREARQSTLPPRVVRELAIPDIAASFQEAVVDVLVTKTEMASQEYAVREVLLAGGVAANKTLRAAMTDRLSVPVRFPPLKFCTDNAAMVASAGFFQYAQGDFQDWRMDVHPRLGLPLE